LAQCQILSGTVYREVRTFWRLRSGEAKVLYLETVVSARGRGVAPTLLRYAAAEMRNSGYERLYARIWHSNHASVRAFEKAGWRQHRIIVDFAVLGLRLRLVWRPALFPHSRLYGRGPTRRGTARGNSRPDQAHSTSGAQHR
jgi:L-amino acid N-acyltransferase YncA